MIWNVVTVIACVVIGLVWLFGGDRPSDELVALFLISEIIGKLDNIVKEIDKRDKRIPKHRRTYP